MSDRDVPVGQGGCGEGRLGLGEKERKVVRNAGEARASMHQITQVEVREGLGLGLGA